MGRSVIERPLCLACFGISPLCQLGSILAVKSEFVQYRLRPQRRQLTVGIVVSGHRDVLAGMSPSTFTANSSRRALRASIIYTRCSL